MVTRKAKASLLPSIIFGSVWLVMGLWAKVLGGVPRHEAIVARILSEDWSRELIIAIGLGEIAFAVWLFSRIEWRLACWLQILLVLVMNALEITLASDLLLFGPLNGLVAIGYAAFVYFVGLKKQPVY